MGNSSSSDKGDETGNAIQEALGCCTLSGEDGSQVMEVRRASFTPTNSRELFFNNDMRKKSETQPNARRSSSAGKEKARQSPIERRSSVAKFIDLNHHAAPKSPAGPYKPLSHGLSAKPAAAQSPSTPVAGTPAAGKFHNFHLPGEQLVQEYDSEDLVDPFSKPVFFRSPSSEGVPKNVTSPSANKLARTPTAASTPSKKQVAKTEQDKPKRTSSSKERGAEATNQDDDADAGEKSRSRRKKENPAWTPDHYDMTRTRSEVFQEKIRSGEVKFCGSCSAIMGKRDKVCHECDQKYDKSMDTRNPGNLINGDLMLSQLRRYRNVKHIEMYERQADTEMAKPHQSEGEVHGFVDSKGFA